MILSRQGMKSRRSMKLIKIITTIDTTRKNKKTDGGRAPERYSTKRISVTLATGENWKIRKLPAVKLTKPVIGVVVTATTSHREGRASAGAAGVMPPARQPFGKRETLRAAECLTVPRSVRRIRRFYDIARPVVPALRSSVRSVDHSVIWSRATDWSSLSIMAVTSLCLCADRVLR